jgi:hypothetical protein
MDSGVLARVLDDVLAYGGDYRIDRLDVGRAHDDESYARLVVSAADDESLNRLLMRLQAHGVNQVDPGEALLREVQQDGVFPDDFYSTTNLETLVRLGSTWVPVEQPEMDCGLLVHGEARIRTVPVSDVKAGDRVVCGAGGVKVELPQREPSSGDTFEFMGSAVSSEKPQSLLLRQIAQQMREVKADGGKVLWVGGPAVVHTGAAPAMVALVEAGYVDVCSPATRWPPTTSRRRCTAPRSAWTWPRARASSTATSTTSGRSTRSARPAPSRRPSSRAC